MANCVQACSTLENTSTSRGKATRRTSPAFTEMDPRPMLLMRAKKFHGNNAHNRNQPNPWSPLLAPRGASASKSTPKMNE